MHCLLRLSEPLLLCWRCAGAGAVFGAHQETLEERALQLRLRVQPAQIYPPGPDRAGAQVQGPKL
jgi:hypothetical protein